MEKVAGPAWTKFDRMPQLRNRKPIRSGAYNDWNSASRTPVSVFDNRLNSDLLPQLQFYLFEKH